MLPVSANAADGDILNEDFSRFTGMTYKTTSKEGWSLELCGFTDNDTYKQSLVFNYHSGSVYSSATTPTFYCANTCNAILTFYCANSSSGNKSTLTMTLHNSGVFSDGLQVRSLLIDEDDAEFHLYQIFLYNVDNTTSLTFTLNSDNAFFLDNVKISKSETITVSENSDYSLKEQIADIRLERTLKGGTWNTLCLPFNTRRTSLERGLGSNQDIKIRLFSSYADNTITMTDAGNELINAGTPFLIKINNTVENPTFPLTTMRTTAAKSVSNNGVSMVGTYGPTELPQDGVFLSGTDGQLKRPSGSRLMKGLRAYFVIPSSAQNARITISDGDATAISELASEVKEADERWYMLDGRPLENRPSRKGIYINNNRKIIIK